MKVSNSYQEWLIYAKELDSITGNDDWKLKNESSLYYHKELEKFLNTIKWKRVNKDIKGLVFHLRTKLVKNFSNLLHPLLYRHSHTGTKRLIEDFQEEVVKCLNFIANFNEKFFPLNKKLEFFSETKHFHGRTALMLSGGGTLGIYHVGVIKALLECNLMPRVLCGSSAGSILASFVCTSTKEELSELLNLNKDIANWDEVNNKIPYLGLLWRKITRGIVIEMDLFSGFIRRRIGDITFQEAYDKTGWILNITVTGFKEHDNHRVLNFITAPNVLIWTASAASCSVPGVFEPVELLCKNEFGHIVPYKSPHKTKFVDGSISGDIPMQKIAELFNVNAFIVSQVNPFVIPFLDNDHYPRFFNTKKLSFWRILKNLIGDEIAHRCNQLKMLGLLPNMLTKYFNIFQQRYKGTVTIFPATRIFDFIRMITNPTLQDRQLWTTLGMRRTFPKISMIESCLKVELELDKHIRKIKNKINLCSFLNEKNYLNEEKYNERGIKYSKNINNVKKHFYLKNGKHFLTVLKNIQICDPHLSNDDNLYINSDCEKGEISIENEIKTISNNYNILKFKED
jgi:predicted acylesterase/phospholipase RssA